MKKIVSLMLVAALCLLCLAGCGETPAGENGNTAAAPLKVGMECAYAPFNWTQTDDANGAVKIANADGFANGYDVQIAKKIADALGRPLEVYTYEWDALVPAVDAGTLDCVIAGMSPTDERKEVVDFSANYYTSNLVVILKKDNPFASAKSLNDLKGAKINAQDGTFHADAVKQIPEVQSAVMKDFTMLFTAVTAGTIDGYIAEEPTAFAICDQNADLTYVALKNNDTGFTCEDGDVAIAVAMKKGAAIADKVNETINAISDADRSALMQQMVSLAPAE